MRLVPAAVAGGVTAAIVTATFSGGGATILQPGQATSQAPASTPGGGLTGCVAPSVKGLDADQVANAKTIVDAAIKAGVGQSGAVIGVATALVEGAYTRGEPEGSTSGLRNVKYGDRDSVGLFQQRPSQGWGTVAELTNPAVSAGKFFTALKRVDGWQSMPPGVAAQAVQRSAFPARYAGRMTEANAFVKAITGAPACKVAQAAPKGACPPSGLATEAGLKPVTLRGLRCGKQAFPDVKSIGGLGNRPNKSDHPMGYATDFMIPAWSTKAGNAFGWEVAHWFEANSADLDVKFIIFDDQIWRPSGSKKGWRPYTHPNGPTRDANLRHLNHVHVSFLHV